MSDLELRELERAARDERTTEAIARWRNACVAHGEPWRAGFAKGDLVRVTCGGPRFFYLERNMQVDAADAEPMVRVSEKNPSEMEYGENPGWAFLERTLLLEMREGSWFDAWVTLVGVPLPGLPRVPSVVRMLATEGMPDALVAQRITLSPKDRCALRVAGTEYTFGPEGVARLRDVRGSR